METFVLIQNKEIELNRLNTEILKLEKSYKFLKSQNNLLKKYLSIRLDKIYLDLGEMILENKESISKECILKEDNSNKIFLCKKYKDLFVYRDDINYCYVTKCSWYKGIKRKGLYFKALENKWLRC